MIERETDHTWTPKKEDMMDKLEREKYLKRVAELKARMDKKKDDLREAALSKERAEKRAYMRAWRDKNRAHYKELMKRGYAKWKAKKAAEMPPPDSSISKMSSLPSDARAAQRIKEETQ